MIKEVPHFLQICYINFVNTWYIPCYTSWYIHLSKYKICYRIHIHVLSLLYTLYRSYA